MIYEDVDAHVALELKDFVANVNNFWITRIEVLSPYLVYLGLPEKGRILHPKSKFLILSQKLKPVELR